MLFMPSIPTARPACDAGPLRRSGPRMPPSMPRAASGYAPYCTRVRAPLATPPASGRWRWQPRWRIPRASRTGPSVAKAFAEPWHAWVYAGSGPNTGSPGPILHTFEKKRRDRLMALAATHPTWALGWEDEVWWSRLAQPALHAWAPDVPAVRLVEHARPKTD